MLLLAEYGEYRGDAAENLRRLEGAYEPFDPRALDGAAAIVDAIFGTGFAGEPRGLAADAIEAIAVLDAVGRRRRRRRAGSTRRPGEAARVAVARDDDRDVRGGQGRRLDRAGQAAHRRAARHRHRDPAGRAGRRPTSAC